MTLDQQRTIQKLVESHATSKRDGLDKLEDLTAMITQEVSDLQRDDQNVR